MIVKQLTGHVSEETAYLVGDYPYGWRKRTKIRYWVETRPRYGQRFVSQTLNPRTDRWNKPKKSIYSSVLVMGLNEEDHVKCEGIGSYVREDILDAFIERFILTKDQMLVVDLRLRALARTNKRLVWKCVTSNDGEKTQTMEEQIDIFNGVFRGEYYKLVQERKG